MLDNSSEWVAIAGATGNAGKEVVRSASASGLRVRALVRNKDRLGDVLHLCEDVRIVQVTQPETLKGCLKGVRFVVSCLGKTFQNDSTPRHDVDVGANINLMNEAKQTEGIERFCLLSVFMASVEHPVSMIRMKGEAEKALHDSGLSYTIIQPSGFFSDMWEIFEMARSGTYWSVGDGTYKFNPISLVDLGDFLVSKLLNAESINQTYPVGGPDVFPAKEVAAIASRVLNKEVKIHCLPLWLCKGLVGMVAPFSRNYYELGNFFVGNADYIAKNCDNDGSVPCYGVHHLEDYIRERYTREQAENAQK
ncbi:hypothetical protein SARC_06075 [Sphaeroforma arctica JP610]|uniref:NAD(P)-binding domain-containing protein n=1 Tax=Sphaeroforma arctica JP610 TaxID=667725 RepID=A0A0L0FYC6_9EUKA|nr:hypothetical protein SARC_06075 [Sphaeroforma arctica JP610]KNC81619.1 hypothetical protein SARC_06075 [Sphaeroforma arctica JP610]|eukprot:XP_014155521.1 hypothetical protein SARC_06075 [Sphaeroforma arctica JP610]